LLLALTGGIDELDRIMMAVSPGLALHDGAVQSNLRRTPPVVT